GEFGVVGFEESGLGGEDVGEVGVVEMVQKLLTEGFVVEIKVDLTGKVLNGGKGGVGDLGFEDDTGGNFNREGLGVAL
ncbi:hypothetical protein, partial [Neisseria sicca]|uniref:hypothetical protein n=1 Tax=Neisseria sicca TaxID=490 RepID=UPI001C99F0CA